MSKRFLVAVVAAGYAVVVLASPAAGHALLRSSSPEAGERLADPPSTISLTFTEPPEVSLSSVRVLDASGQTRQQGDPRVAADDEFTLEVAVGDLADGVYTVTWRTVSQADGHATAGSFAFGVGVQPSGGGGGAGGRGTVESPPTSPLEVVGRFLFLAGVVFAIGAGALGAFVATRRRAALFLPAVIGLSAALVGLVVLLIAQLRAADSSLSVFMGTPVGEAVLWRAGGLSFAVGLALAAGRRGESGVMYGGIALGAALAAFAHVEAGHAAAQTTLRWPNIVGQWVHVVAAGVWIGGLASLLLVTRGEPNGDKAGIVKRFSTLAGVTLVVVAGAGVFRALNEIDGWDELFDTGYGRTVVAKIAGILLLATLGALNRYRSVPAAKRDLTPLRRVGRFEVIGGVVVIALAGLLASVSPPAPSDVAAAQEPAVVVTGSDFATTVRARLRIEPGTAGLNSFRAELSDYDSGDPVSARRVTLRFSFVDGTIPPSDLVLDRRAPGVFAGQGANLALDGRWEISIIIEQASGSLDVPLEVETSCRAERIVDPGAAPIWVMELGDGRTLQSYVDPGPAGGQLVHLTFFDANGDELKVATAPSLSAARGDDETSLDVRRFAPGHFVAEGQLEAGDWRFRVVATLDGQEVSACFEESVE